MLYFVYWLVINFVVWSWAACRQWISAAFWKKIAAPCHWKRVWGVLSDCCNLARQLDAQVHMRVHLARFQAMHLCPKLKLSFEELLAARCGFLSLRVTFHMQDCYIMYECIFQNVPLSLCNTDNTYNQPDQVTSYTHTGTLYHPSNSPNKQLNYFSAALCWTSNLPFPPLCVLSL